MRISTQHIFNLAEKSMADANRAIVRTQEELSTGKKVLSSADDPVAAVRIQKLNEYLGSIDQFNKNISLAENSLSLEESTLGSINNLLQRVEELAVQSGNTATLRPEDYDAIASEVESRVKELVGLMNTRNANDDYIFSGYKSKTPAFSGDINSGFQYQGDEGQLSIKIDKDTFVNATDSGKDIFVDVPSSNRVARASVASTNRSDPSAGLTSPVIVDQNAYDAFYPEDMVITFNEDSAVTPAGKNFTITERSTGKVLEANRRFNQGEEITVEGLRFRLTGNPASSQAGQNNGDRFFIDSSQSQDMLSSIQQFYHTIKNYDGSESSRESLKTMVANTINNISNAQVNLNESLSSIGARTNTLESVRNAHADSNLVSREILSDLSDVDYAEAASRLSAQTLVLQAAQASFLQIRDLNLISRL